MLLRLGEGRIKRRARPLSSVAHLRQRMSSVPHPQLAESCDRPTTRRARDWPYLSFHVCVRRGLKPADWGGDVEEPMMHFGERREVSPDFAELTLGRTEGATRGLHPGYLLFKGRSSGVSLSSYGVTNSYSARSRTVFVVGTKEWSSVKQRNDEAMGTFLMRQRDASWEHSSVRQHAFSP